MLYLRKGLVVTLFVFIFAWFLSCSGVYASLSGNVKDDLDYLNEEQMQNIQDLIDKAVVANNLDIVIVITDNTEGKSSQDYADDCYDTNGFGVGDDKSGILMLINMQERQIWISTTGKAIDIFTDSRISDMTGVIAGFLSAGNYYDACIGFVDKVKSYAQEGVPPGQYRVDESQTINTDTEKQSEPVEQVARTDTKTPGTYTGRVSNRIKSGLIYVVAFIIALLAVVIVRHSSKTKITVTNQTYEEDGSFVLSGSSDIFLRESTSRVKIEKSSPKSLGSNSSTTHSSSSGTTHGGGGRKF